MNTKFLMIVSAGLFLTSCVSMNKHRALEADYQVVSGQRAALNDEVNALGRENATLKSRLRDLEAQMIDIQNLTKERGELQQELKEVKAMLEKTRVDRMKETTGMSQQIADDQEALLKKEDELLERMNQIQKMREEMEARNTRLAELEAILARKDSAVNALKAKVSDALLGFEGKGLTVIQKNGKVFVSMEDKLLFKSGSYEIDPKGAEAINELSKVLAKNIDINIMVEGHTDDVPYRNSQSADLKDNWDLSVKRATTVVRTLLKNTGVDPKRIVAAGHSEYMPLDPNKTTAARQKNRRTEIILTPKLDELLSVLESN